MVAGENSEEDRISNPRNIGQTLMGLGKVCHVNMLLFSDHTVVIAFSPMPTLANIYQIIDLMVAASVCSCRKAAC